MIQESFEQWAIVELLGRHVIAGRVTEQTIAGAGFVRVDVPHISDPDSPAQCQFGFTKLFGAGAIYAITPTDEATVRAVATRLKTRPIELWVLPDPSVRLIRPAVEDEDYETADHSDADFHDDPPDEDDGIDGGSF